MNYVYQYKDHLGNVRLSYTDNNNDGVITPSTEIIEESNYYPFGLKHKGYNGNISSIGNSVAQKKQYNGKEFQDELGLNWIDYGARNYSPDLGRWMNIDPLAQEYFDNSPYNYVANTPLVAYDPDGKRIAIVGNEEYVTGVLKYLFSLAQQSKLGAKLVMNAISSDRTFVIFDPNNEKAHGEVKNFSDDGSSEGYSTLGFDLNKANEALDSSNGSNGKSLFRTGETTLGHELSHFSRNNKYPYDVADRNGYGLGFGPDEVAAVRDENQIRREIYGNDTAQRTHYRGVNIFGSKAQKGKDGLYRLVRDKNYSKQAAGATRNQFDSFFFNRTTGQFQQRGSYYRSGSYLNRQIKQTAEKPKPNKEFSLSEKKN